MSILLFISSSSNFSRASKYRLYWFLCLTLLIILINNAFGPCWIRIFRALTVIFYLANPSPILSVHPAMVRRKSETRRHTQLNLTRVQPDGNPFPPFVLSIPADASAAAPAALPSSRPRSAEIYRSLLFSSSLGVTYSMSLDNRTRRR